MHTGSDYWKNYMEKWFGASHIADWQKSCKEVTITSNKEPLHLETYIAGYDKPTFIFSHGIAGYARLLLPFILPLYHRGINIICPDLKGCGYNQHTRGDFTFNEHVTNLIDAAKYAREKFKGPIFMGGASLGGPLAYEAASRLHGGISGLICWSLWDLSDSEYIENETAFKKKSPLLYPLMKVASSLFGSFRIKTSSLISLDALSNVADFNEMVRNDPQSLPLISVRAAFSLLLQSRPNLAYASFIKPVLIFQGGADTMTPAHYTYDTYLKIGCPDKRYIELDDAPHFPVHKKFYDEWCSKVSTFIKLNS